MISLSVVVPNYNHGHWLERSLRGLAEQADSSVEILAIDDGSTDDSVAIIERLALRYPSIKLLRHDRNRGVSAGLKTGITAASGEFLYFAAADDRALPGLFHRATTALRQWPEAAFFCSGAVMIDTGDQIIGFRPITYPRATAGFLSPDDVRRAFLRSDNWFVGSSVIYRHRHLADIGYFDESLGSLTDGLANRLLGLKHGCYFEPEVLSAWRRYSESYSGKVAMDVTASETSLATAARWIDERLPPDYSKVYAKLFDRRYRFNLARLRLAWIKGAPDVGQLASLLRLGPIDTAIVKILARVPALRTQLILSWLTLRLRPFAPSALAAAWWRSITINRTRRPALQRIISDVREDPSFAPAACSTRAAAEGHVEHS
jgi:glycosyltransferase involved in cell wall biosynthesis